MSVTGEIENFRELDRNAYDWETSGIDMQVDWRFDLGPGQVGVNWFVSWVDEFTTSVVDSSAPPLDRGGVGSESKECPPCRNGSPTCT